MIMNLVFSVTALKQRRVVWTWVSSWKKAINCTLKNWVAYQIMHALVIMHDQDIEETAGLLFRNTTEEEGRRGVFILLREIFCPQDIPSSMIFHETLHSLWVVCTQSISKMFYLFFLLMRWRWLWDAAENGKFDFGTFRMFYLLPFQSVFIFSGLNLLHSLWVVCTQII